MEYIIIGLLISIIILFVYLLLQYEKVRRLSYEYFLKAENMLYNNGKEKMEYVLERTYSFLPVTIKMFITKDLFKKIIQKFFDEIKDLLDDGKINKSV